jgi:hypothetical protein
MARAVVRNDILYAGHGDGERAGLALRAGRLPRLNPAPNPRPVLGNLHR